MTTALRATASPVYNRLFWLTFAANTVLVLANALTFRFAEFVTFLGGTEQVTGTVISVGVLSAVAVRFRLGQDIDACGTRRFALADLATKGVKLRFRPFEQILPLPYHRIPRQSP